MGFERYEKSLIRTSKIRYRASVHAPKCPDAFELAAVKG